MSVLHVWSADDLRLLQRGIEFSSFILPLSVLVVALVILVVLAVLVVLVVLVVLEVSGLGQWPRWILTLFLGAEQCDVWRKMKACKKSSRLFSKRRPLQDRSVSQCEFLQHGSWRLLHSMSRPSS